MKKKLFIICFIFLVLLAIYALFEYQKFLKLQIPPVAPSVSVTDRFGVPMRDFLSPDETYSKPVALEEVSPWLILSLVAVEDKRFFTHGGVDIKAVSRAAWQNATAGEIVSGASTITQQLVRVVEPRKKSFSAKAKEGLAALLLERKLTKHQILENYFNNVEFYNNLKGVEAASEYYFNVNAKNVSLAQAAFLAAMLKSPAKYNPLKNFTKTLERQKNILKKMLDAGFIAEEIYDISMREQIAVSAESRPFSAPHLAYILLKDNSAPVIKTTLDARLQNAVSELVPVFLEKMKKHNITNAAVIALDNKTGETLAYLGSADYFDKAHNGAVNGVTALRQPGSALKPFIYGLALENGYTPATIIKDEDVFFEGGFRPKNYDESFHGDVRLRTALACSYNVPVVRVTEKLGVHKVLAMLHGFGFDSLKKGADVYGLGIALGNGEVTLLELARAYSALANGGVLRPVRYTFEPQRERPARALGAASAYLITDILSDNSARAPAFGLNSPLALPFPFAAKTGTSKDYKDNWSIGYTNRYTVGVWVGNFSGAVMQKSSGITGAAPLLKDIALETEKLYPSSGFERPRGIVQREIKTANGKITEIFDENNLPREEEESKQEIKEQIIFFPAEGDVFKIDMSVPLASQQIGIRAAPGAYCEINQKALAKTGKIWFEMKEGNYTLVCTLNGHKESVNFIIL